MDIIGIIITIGAVLLTLLIVFGIIQYLIFRSAQKTFQSTSKSMFDNFR